MAQREVHVTPDTPGVPEGKGWEVASWDGHQHTHVVPVNDLIAHSEDDDGECVCVPDVEYVNERWSIVHHSLDGRELTEPGWGF